MAVIESCSHATVSTKELRLCSTVWGDCAKTPVLLVHGYPDNSGVWQAVAEILSEDYFVMTYDVRGSGRSEAPLTREGYQLEHLIEDMNHVVSHWISHRCFHLVGHDWGSIQGWEAVTTAPMRQRILSFTSISGPCLDHVGYWVRAKLATWQSAAQKAWMQQLLRSWYIGLIHLPGLSWLGWNMAGESFWPWFLRQYQGVKQAPVNPAQVVDGMQGVGLYRANILQRILKPQQRYARCPVQLVILTQDHFVDPQLFEDMDRWVAVLCRRELSAHHWAMLSHPAALAALVRSFIHTVECGQAHTD